MTTTVNDMLCRSIKGGDRPGQLIQAQTTAGDDYNIRTTLAPPTEKRGVLDNDTSLI